MPVIQSPGTSLQKPNRMREAIEIEVASHVDVWKLRDYLQKISEVKANVVTLAVIRVWHNPARVAAKVILKEVQAFSTKGTGRRTKNIVSAKEYKGAA